MDAIVNDQASTHPLLHALVRFESVAALYPATHMRVADAGEELLGAIRACRDASGVVQIASVAGRLLVQSSEVADKGAAARRLREEFDVLGVVAVDFAGDVTLEELHAFASTWRSTVQSVANTHGLRTAELENLPATIRTRYREFGKRLSLGAGAAADGEQSAEVAADDNNAREACQRLLEKAMRRVAARMKAPEDSSELRAPPPGARALDDVLQIAGHVLQNAIERYLTESSNVRDLPKLFNSIELATAASPDAESARILLDVLRQSAEEALEDQAAEVEQEFDRFEPDREYYERSIDSLRTELATQCAGQLLETLEVDDRRERLSILFDLAEGSHAGRSSTALAERLHKALSEPLVGSESETVQAAVRELCTRARADAIDRALPEIAAALGDSESQLWFAPLLEVAAAADVERLEVLWPHLANQLLLGPSLRTSAFLAAATDQVARLPRAKLTSGVRRLQHLNALLEGHVTRHAFAPPRASLGYFYVALLGSTHGPLVGAHLLAHLRVRPDAWPGARAFACVRTCDREVCDLLARIFAAHSPAEQQQAQLACARFLVCKLETLPRASRNEAWLAPALEWLGNFELREISTLFKRVVDERQVLVVPAWPAACRAAAARAIAHARDPAKEPTR